MPENQCMYQGVRFLSRNVEIPVHAELLYLRHTCFLAVTKVPAEYLGTACKEASEFSWIPWGFHTMGARI